MYSILDFGAVANSKKLCTQSIQATIDECAKCGGGRVVIPAGVFITGTIYLKDNVELYLENGAILKASTNLDDYNEEDAYEQNWGCKNEGWCGKHLIIAVECNNTAITGNGIIDGSASAFYGDERNFINGYEWEEGYVFTKDLENLRPGQLICFIESTNVKVENITIQNTTSWGCFMHGCEYVQVRGLKVLNPIENVNTDGLDIDCCRYVTVSDCIINTGDDAIAIRCSSQRLKHSKPCEYITITNCMLASSSSAFRIGVGYGEIRHVRISNTTVSRAGTLISYMTTIGSKGKAIIEDVNFSNISAFNVGLAVACFSGEVGAVKNITMENMRIKSQAGIIVQAYEEGDISDIVLRNIDLDVHTERKKINEKYIVKIQNANDVLVDGLRVFSDLNTWDDAFCEKECQNIIIKDCVFSK